MADENDDLGLAIEAAMGAPASAAVDTPAIVDTSPAPDAPKTDDRPRDEQGKFVAKEAEAPKSDTKPVDAAALIVAAPVVDQAKPAAQTVIPPTNWNGAGKIDFARLPAPIQKQISDDYSRLSQTQAQLDSLNAAIGPQRAQALAATYGSTENALKSLLAMSDMASQDAPGFVQWFCKQRGVDLSQLVGQGQAQGEQPMQPHPLEQEVRQLRDQLQSFAQQQQQGSQTQLRQEMDTFAADPAHPYFNDVRPDMAALIGAGRAKNLQEAYDMAVWARPDIRSSLIAAERQKLADEDAAKAQQARNASVSISGSPQGAQVALDEPDDDLEGTIRKQVGRAFS